MLFHFSKVNTRFPISLACWLHKCHGKLNTVDKYNINFLNINRIFLTSLGYLINLKVYYMCRQDTILGVSTYILRCLRLAAGSFLNFWKTFLPQAAPLMKQLIFYPETCSCHDHSRINFFLDQSQARTATQGAKLSSSTSTRARNFFTRQTNSGWNWHQRIDYTFECGEQSMGL